MRLISKDSHLALVNCIYNASIYWLNGLVILEGKNVAIFAYFCFWFTKANELNKQSFSKLVISSEPEHC